MASNPAIASLHEQEILDMSDIMCPSCFVQALLEQYDAIEHRCKHSIELYSAQVSRQEEDILL